MDVKSTKNLIYYLIYYLYKITLYHKQKISPYIL